ncbi:hypothetical protein KA093_01795 [Candidatus Saccharibacteria bacterium]|nr:hypothetical protein [Candidatus Saccharibacteria bacterium]
MNYYKDSHFPEIDLSDPTAVVGHVVRYIDEHKQLFLATVDDFKRPWIVSLNWRHDENFNFYWKSKVSSLHSSYLRHNPESAICLSSETPEYGEFGLYCTGQARELVSRKEIEQALLVRYSDGTSRTRVSDGDQVRANPIADFMGDSPSRMYLFETDAMWLNENQHRKVEVDLDLLRRLSTTSPNKPLS